MKRITLIASIITLFSGIFLFTEEKADSIIKEMDERMNFTECRMKIRIEDKDSGGKERSLSARVEYSANIGTRIEFTEPARDKGKRILMSGDSMWMASPAVSKPVRLSGKDSFMGTTFTNDDMMNFDKSDDYESIISSEDAEGWDIVMSARKSGLPYSKIAARIGKDFLPRKMSYFARSGKESKQVEYSDLRDFGGKKRPGLMAIRDLMEIGAESRVVFEEIMEGAIDRSRLSPTSFGK
jgi:outer membrane lipoprotein-sorting protein